MQLVVFGLNHRTAPLEVRERWAFTPDESRHALCDLREKVPPSEHLILSTCNRTEFYSSFGREASAPHAVSAAGSAPFCETADFYHRFYNEVSKIVREKAARDFDPSYFYVYRQDAAVEHLFRLAGGLESMILGESQILKQLKDAYAVAGEARTAGRLFHRLFPAALRVGKKVRSLTRLSDGCITPGQAALRLARGVLGDLADRSLMVVGSGKIGTSALKAFQDVELKNGYVLNRTSERAQELVERLGRGVALPFSRLESTIRKADLIISSTGAVEPIVTRDMLARAQKARGNAALVVVDLAVPRDFEPGCSTVSGVHLFNIDDLNRVIQENVAERIARVPHAEALVREELASFQRWVTYLDIDPVLSHMVKRFEEIRLGELQAYLGRFPPESRPVLEELTSSLVKKLLHFPIEKLKSLRDLSGLSDAEVSFLKRLFLTNF